MFLIECGLVLIAVVFAFAAPMTGSRFFRQWRDRFPDLLAAGEWRLWQLA